MSSENKEKEKSYEEYMKEGLEQFGLNRAIIKSGGTNPDYPATLAQGIINETSKESWDVSYIMEKIEKLNDFITWENNRFNSLKRARDEGKSVDEITKDTKKVVEVFQGIVEVTEIIKLCRENKVAFSNPVLVGSIEEDCSEERSANPDDYFTVKEGHVFEDLYLACTCERDGWTKRIVVKENPTRYDLRNWKELAEKVKIE